MAEETTEVAQEDLTTSTPEPSEGSDAPVELASETETQATTEAEVQTEAPAQATIDNNPPKSPSAWAAEHLISRPSENHTQGF